MLKTIAVSIIVLGTLHNKNLTKQSIEKHKATKSFNGNALVELFKSFGGIFTVDYRRSSNEASGTLRKPCNLPVVSLDR